MGLRFMADRKRAAGGFGKFLDDAARAAYVVDQHGRLAAFNRAALDQFGPELAAILGQFCRYGAAPGAGPGPALSAALAVPPELPSAGQQAALLCWRFQGQNWQALAEFHDLGGDETEDEPRGPVLVLVGPGSVASAAHGPSQIDAGTVLPGALHASLASLRAEFQHWFHIERLAGKSYLAERLRSQVQAAAASEANVLVVGPAGSGKQHLARTIYLASDGDFSRPCLPLACELLGEDLLRRTLAAWPKPSAEGQQLATLLLEQVDRLPAEGQADLWAALQKTPRAFRVLATAEQSPLELAERGQFHVGLAHALSTWVLETGTLAARIDDLPWLAQAFLEVANAGGTKQLAGFSPEALAQLALYAWPGNLDELARVVAAAHAVAEGPLVALADLPSVVRTAGELRGLKKNRLEPIDLEQVLADIETDLLRQALRAARGNKTKAAELLGLTRPRLYRRLVQRGLEVPSAVEGELPVFEPAPDDGALAPEEGRDEAAT